MGELEFEAPDSLPEAPQEQPAPRHGTVTSRFFAENGAPHERPSTESTRAEYEESFDRWVDEPGEPDEYGALSRAAEGAPYDQVATFAEGALQHPDIHVRDWASRYLQGDPSARQEWNDSLQLTAQQHADAYPVQTLTQALSSQGARFAEEFFAASDYRAEQAAAEEAHLEAAQHEGSTIAYQALRDAGLSERAAAENVGEAWTIANEILEKDLAHNAELDAVYAEMYGDDALAEAHRERAERAIAAAANEAAFNRKYESATQLTRMAQHRRRQADQAAADRAAGLDPSPSIWDVSPGLQAMARRMAGYVERRQQDPMAGWKERNGFTARNLERMPIMQTIRKARVSS